MIYLALLFVAACWIVGNTKILDSIGKRNTDDYDGGNWLPKRENPPLPPPKKCNN
jgi:hypothetical protein